MINESYHIATSTDETYFVPMYVMLYSLFRNNDASFTVHILYNHLQPEQISEVETLTAKYNNHINWVQVTDEKVKTYYTSVYLSTATYYRILIPFLLPSDIQKVLYLDADIIVHSNIKELLETDPGNNPVMAVKEVIPHQIDRIGIPAGYDYFNAGVLLLNLDEWRTHNYAQQVLKNIETQHANYLMHDQDALNAFFYTQVKYLHPKWNHQSGFYQLNHTQLESRYRENAFMILKHPAIVHFIGASKPWQYLCTHPYKSLFLHYLAQTPYNDFSESPTLPRIAQKTARRIKHKLKKIFT